MQICSKIQTERVRSLYMYMCSHLGFIPKITTVSTSKQYTSIRDIWLQCIMCIKDYTGADLQRCSCSARRVSGCVGLSSLSRAAFHFKAVLFAMYHVYQKLSSLEQTCSAVVHWCSCSIWMCRSQQSQQGRESRPAHTPASIQQTTHSIAVMCLCVCVSVCLCVCVSVCLSCARPAVQQTTHSLTPSLSFRRQLHS